ncbi:FimV/HubP family polar landmark protein [Marinobacter piscensis]|uniref:FimV/HubP family polar landmark protein n=1 Tax=Marinobacter piscensis TaxID=1562308 RepID=UPI0011A6D5D8|nr:FimV/HubP family polar landmark protein [Marinobacter piscensis]
MKVRKLAVALALAGGLGSGIAQALGLGEIELRSYLNEPMNADIVLPQSRGVDSADVFVNVAPEKAYRRLGLDRNQFVGKLQFDVETQPDGSLVVNVSSREPLREPYLNFLLELTWPNGRLMREYAVLVDPPVYAEESGVKEQVRAPSSRQADNTAAPSARNSGTANRQPQNQSSQSTRYQRETFGPTGEADTLWSIASALRPDNSVTTQQVMLALQDLNPDAFIDNNINKLKRGQVLRVPSADQIRSRSHAQASRMVAQQNQQLEDTRRTVDATPTRQTDNDTEKAQAGTDELKLIVADDEGRRSESEGGSAGGDGALAGGADAGSAVAMEELDRARRENAELSERLDDLQEQVETLQRLLELKNSQLAGMQEGVANSDPDSGRSDAATEQPSPQSEGSADTADPAGEAEANDPDASVQAEDIADQQSEPKTDETDTPANTSDVAASEGGDDSESATGDIAEEESSDAGAVTAAPETLASAPEQNTQPESRPAIDKGFPANMIDAVINNRTYQFALGGGLLVLLLILLLLARRSASKEKEFYEQFNRESDDFDDTLDLGLTQAGAKETAEPEPAEEPQNEESSAFFDNKLLADQYDAGQEDEVEEEFSDFEAELSKIDSGTIENAEISAETSADSNQGEEDVFDLDLDESFLDELDAELDKVAGEDSEPEPELEPEPEPEPEPELGGSEMEESTLDDFEMDLSHDDLALMDEFTDSADPASEVSAEDDLSLDEELNLEDALESESEPESEPEAESAEPGLDDDDEFDFLAGTDENATKLDLARAYVEMGDQDGARDILEEVAVEGDESQKGEAQELLKNLN